MIDSFFLSGKTHRIYTQYIRDDTLCLSINDKLSLSSLISSLISYDSTMTLDDSPLVYINISIHAPLDQLNRTFFSLFICGSLTDPITGLTFTLCNMKSWKFIIEIPYSSKHAMDIQENLNYFFPVLAIIGQSAIEIITHEEYQLHITDEEELVARYLKAYFNSTIDRRRRHWSFASPDFQALDDEDECRQYICQCIERYAPHERGNRIYEVSFTKFLARRVRFFLSPFFTLNEIIPNLGTIVMTQMIQEAKSLSEISFEDDNYPRTYLVYDPGFSLHLLHNNWNEVSVGLKSLWKNVDPLIRIEFLNKNHFLKCLSWLVDAQYEPCEQIMNRMKFIMTENFAYKLFHIHERKLTALPLIIEGDTGIGKTYLLQFYSLLLNAKIQYDYDQTKFRAQILERTSVWLSQMIFTKILEKEPSLLNEILERIKPKLMDAYQVEITDDTSNLDKEYSDDDDDDDDDEDFDQYDEEVEESGSEDEDEMVALIEPVLVSNENVFYVEEQENIFDEPLTTDQTQRVDTMDWNLLKQCKTSLIKYEYTADMLLYIWQTILLTAQKSSVALAKLLLRTKRQFIKSELTSLPLIDISSTQNDLLENSPLTIRTSMQMLTAYLLDSRVEPVFYRLLIHPGITEEELKRFLLPIADLARKWVDVKLVVFFDEVNTSSCIGLFKEIFTDRTLNGTSLPQNIFFTAAVNPALDLADQENRVHRVDYLVHQLPQSLEHLKVRYGALDSKTLDDYITQKVAKFDLNFAMEPEQSTFLQGKLKRAILTAQAFCEEKLGRFLLSLQM